MSTASPTQSFFQRAFSPLFARLSAAWAGLDGTTRLHTTVLAGLMVGSLAHYLVFITYFIEDAGISFAYARNWAEGEGFVTFAGGERVEGFSNPLWTWICAAFYVIGVPPFTTAKLLGAAFGAGTLPLAWALTKEARGRLDAVALIPPLLLAASSTYAIWNASGLENSLFGVLLTAGMLLILREAERPQAFPWSAVMFLGLAITRPEGVVYAAVAGLVRLVLAIRARQVVVPIAKWLVVFWAPFLVYQAWRYNYFAWPFPNTFYAKVDGEDRFKPWSWGTKGWLYIRNYMSAFGIGYVLPLALVAMTGLRDRRRWLTLGLTALCALVWLWNGRDGLPDGFDPNWLAKLQLHWDKVRVGAAIFAVVAATVATLGERGAAARVLCLGQVVAGLFFVLYSGGDWMAQWRFFSYFAVPGFVLIGLGLGRLLDAVPPLGRERLGMPTLRLITLTVFVLVIGTPNIWQSAWAAPSPETTISDVKQRVEYMTWVQRRLHLERVTLWDVDMGAHMYYTDWRILDVAGLVDVPVSRHLYQKAFIREYLFLEERPHFAHMHGGWASKVKITTHPEWKRDYIEIPGYPSGRKQFHIGNHIRKDIFVRPSYEGPEGRRAMFKGGVTLEGWDILSPEVPEEGRVVVDVWLKAGFRKAGVRVIAVLDDGAGHQHAFAVPPGYDWYKVTDWKNDEHVRGTFDLDLPKSLPKGTYDLGFVLLDEKSGAVLEVNLPPAPAPEAPVEGVEPVVEAPAAPRYMRGELFFDAAVVIVSRDEATTLADEDRLQAFTFAEIGECELAWGAWKQAEHHVAKNTRWHDDYRPEVKTAVAGCYAARAAEAPTPDEQVRWLVEARGYDHNLDAVVTAAQALAATKDAEGDAAAAKEDWEGAYAAYRAALMLDPRLSWTRKKAEEARDKRLDISGKVKDPPPKPSTTRTAPGPKKAGEPDDPKADDNSPDLKPAGVRRPTVGPRGKVPPQNPAQRAPSVD